MTPAQVEAQGEMLWQQLIQADKQYFVARMQLLQAMRTGLDIVSLMRRALDNPLERGPALRLLLNLEEAARRELFPSLIRLASIGHADIQLVREVIFSLDSQWLAEHIPDEIERVLQRSATYEEFRRFAELLRTIHSPYLMVLLEKAAASDDPDIREVVGDFS